MRFIRLLTIGLALTVVSSGCASEPTLDKAAAELQKDTQRLETDSIFKNPLNKLRILQRPDRDIPCGKDKFNRILRATADYERVNEPLNAHLDRAQTLMENTLARVLKYELDFDFGKVETEDGRFIYATKVDPGIKMAVYVAPEAPTWRLYAVTACLSRR